MNNTLRFLSICLPFLAVVFLLTLPVVTDAPLDENTMRLLMCVALIYGMLMAVWMLVEHDKFMSMREKRDWWRGEHHKEVNKLRTS